MSRILILGGTREAADLAAKLAGEGHQVITSLAGRTREPKPVSGQVRVGGFGGAQGLANFLRENRIDKLVDATHPFAKQISVNAEAAAGMAGTPYIPLQRKPWKIKPGDIWHPVEDLNEAIDAIPPRARVLLALGRQHIQLFAERNDVHFVVRMVDDPEAPLPFASHDLLIAKPSSDWKAEKQILLENRISHIVCRNSGGEGAYAKIEAARHLRLPVIIIAHPDQAER